MMQRDEYRAKEILNKHIKKETILDKGKKENTSINNLSSNLSNRLDKVSSNIQDVKKKNKKKGKYKFYTGGKRNKKKHTNKKANRKQKGSKTNKRALKNALNNYIDNRKHRNMAKNTINKGKSNSVSNIDFRKLDLNKLVDNFNKYVSTTKPTKYYKTLIPIINKSFRSFDRVKLNNICENARNNKIVINLESKLLTKYLENYEAIKTTYLDNSVILLDILEKELLVKESISSNTNKPDEPVETIESYRLKTLSTDEIQNIEYRVRDKISTLYYDCQMKYVEGVQLLDEYFIKREELEM